jgi:hypothetical protein
MNQKPKMLAQTRQFNRQFIPIALVLALLLAGCQPIQRPVAEGAETPLAANALLAWQGQTNLGDGDPTACASFQIFGDQRALAGDCDKDSQEHLLPAQLQQEWSQIQQHFAPFRLATATDQLTLRSNGEAAGEPWQRALLAWTHFAYAEVVTGRTSASVRTTLSWFLGEAPTQPGLCNHLTVMAYGYAYAEYVPCGGGAGQEQVGDWLTTEELAQFDAWLYSRQSIYQGENYLAGQGDQPMSEAEVAEVAAWAEDLYVRLRVAKPLFGADPSAAREGCRAPFAAIQAQTADEIQRVVAAFDPPAAGEPMTLDWQPAFWDGLVTQLATAGAALLNECADRATPLAQQLVHQRRLAN